MKWLEVEFLGRRLRVPATKAQGKLWFHWMGTTHVVDTSSGQRRAGGGKGQAKTGVVVAPMPGKVTKVAIQIGERVNKGQLLLVMEAMKMEYSLEADCAGVVQDLTAQVGQQVTLGAVLVRVV